MSLARGVVPGIFIFQRGVGLEERRKMVKRLSLLPVVVFCDGARNLLFQDGKGIQRFGASGQKTSFVHWQRLLCRTVLLLVP